MLRRIPVLANDVGGNRGAKLGTSYLFPVAPIERYETTLDEHMLPTPVVSEQDVDPWAQALLELLTNGERYEHEATRACRDAAVGLRAEHPPAGGPAHNGGAIAGTSIRVE